MPVFIDQTGKNISLIKLPQQIISLVPSQTELLFDLGLENEVAGITKFCVHPGEWFRNKTRVGGTKQLNLEIIRQLKPDLIIANKEENVKEQVDELGKDFPVWISDISNLQDAYFMIEQVGLMTGRIQQAKKITEKIKDKFNRLKTANYRLRTAYFIWQNPYMTVGSDTFIHAMLEKAGFINIFSDKKRYPEITIEELQTAGCQLLFLSSEPFPFKEKHRDELQKKLPGSKVILVDGEMFSWYGSRLQFAPAYFQQLHDQIK